MTSGWRAETFGVPRDVLRWSHFAHPALAPGQVLIEVAVAPVNFADDLLTRGTYQEKPTPPFTPGIEVLGKVVEAGEGASSALGSRVLAYTVLPFGAFAHHAVADGRFAFEVPGEITDREAAGLLISYQTAWIALHRRARLAAGELVVVHAGAGASGSAAIQVARAAGARVIATAGSPEKLEICRRLGADVVVNYRVEDFVAVVKEVSDGRGADVIFDPVGGETFTSSQRAIAWEGRLLAIGFAGGAIPTVATSHALVKNYSIVGVHAGGYRRAAPDVLAQAQAEVFALHRAGRIHPLVGDELPLEDAVEALERVTSGRTTGKVLLRAESSSAASTRRVS